jgi:hypothetical protein
MTRLHMALKSKDQFSMGPSGVEAQSTLRANCICLGRAADIGRRVQSNEEFSGYRVCVNSLVVTSLCAAIIACFGGFPVTDPEVDVNGKGEDPEEGTAGSVASPK